MDVAFVTEWMDGRMDMEPMASPSLFADFLEDGAAHLAEYYVMTEHEVAEAEGQNISLNLRLPAHDYSMRTSDPHRCPL